MLAFPHFYNVINIRGCDAELLDINFPMQMLTISGSFGFETLVASLRQLFIVFPNLEMVIKTFKNQNFSCTLHRRMLAISEPLGCNQFWRYLQTQRN